MEPNLWTQLTHFIKRCHTEHFKEVLGGYFMGFIGAQHLLYSGALSSLVGPVWWVLKGIGTIVLAFGSALATGYAGVIITDWKERRDEKKSSNSSKKNRAA